MCFSLIGEVVENKVKAIAKKMGLGEEKLRLEEIIPNERVSFHSDNVESFSPDQEETLSDTIEDELQQEHESYDENEEQDMGDDDMDSFNEFEDEKGR